MINAEPVQKRRVHRFQRHVSSLIWKSFKQRKRRWRLLAVEVAFASVCFLVVVFVARPVFLASPIIEGGATLSSEDILLSLNKNTEISYVPDIAPYNTIMNRVAQILAIDIKTAATVEDLLQRLRQKSKGSIMDPLIWVIWKQNENNIWKFSIQSTELARSQLSNMEVNTSSTNVYHKHLHSGFLAVQLAISQAVLEQTTVKPLNYEVLLAAMPASPLMHHERVKRVLSWVLLCFTAALLLPVLETQALAVKETKCQLKRAFRMRNVDYSSMYIAWMVYAQMTMLPVCILASITLILTFRWIHFFTAFAFIFAYMCVMLMVEFIMGMFHHEVWSSCIWSAMVTILQTFIAELLIYHNYDDKHPVLVFLVNVLIPPLSLVHGFHQFALLQIGSGFAPRGAQPVLYIVLSWLVMICLYFGILMLLQRTIADAYGGAISWKSIIFKHADNINRVWRVEPVEPSSWVTLQEVDELMAKAVSFEHVYKSIMGVPIMTNVTLDIYRGEYTKFYVEPSDHQMLTTMEDLITGLAYADRGNVNVLGKELVKNVNIMSRPYMMGYCHYFEFLVPELTVEEHIILFAEITLWNESSEYVYEYTLLRMKHLFHDCNLTEVARVLVKNLSVYYRAQLCWALAVLLEPRVVVIGKFKDDPDFGIVIDDKMLQNKGYLTIIKMCYNTLNLQVADRVFLLDNKCLIFGGTPPYMFYKFGRDYRIRVTVSNIGGEDADTEALLARARAAGGTVRAHHGSMVVLRMPVQPASTIAAFIQDITDNGEKYGVSSFHLSLPDTEEVFMRAVTEFRALTYKRHDRMYFKREAIKKICEPNVWRRQFSHCPNIHQISFALRKYFTYYINNKISLTTTIVSSIISGIVIGLLLTEVLQELSDDISNTKATTKSSALTVESMHTNTKLILRSDESEQSLSVANAYVLSGPNILEEHVRKLSYTALKNTENLANYLMIRAVDSPGDYLSLYAYGIDILNINDKLVIQALYNPLHYDTATAARSLARVYMALLRHYSNVRHATIDVYDDPLNLDLTSTLESTKRPPLFIEFMLIMTVAHATLVPSHEHGLIRHTQAHAMDFSPFRYWLTMFICDVLAMLILLSVMTSAMLTVITLNIPSTHYSYLDLVITPIMLFVYGVSCIPQAYLFSLGRSPGLNTMAYVTVNLVFGETIVISRYLYGKLLNVVLFFMNLSPQFNMAYGYVKIVKIFAYNSECLIFDDNKICSSSFLHKCCPQSCGVMQECFQRKSYFSHDGVVAEIFSLTFTMFMFTGLLMLWEYKWLILLFNHISNNWLYNGRMDRAPTSIGMIQETREVRAKKENLKKKKTNPFCLCQEDTFGEVLLVDDMTEKVHGRFELRNISFGIGKGEVLALVGQTKHGRRRLCQMLAGVTLPSTGKATLLNKWNVTSFKYMAHVSLSCERYFGPPWMRLRKVLEMLALFRGMPRKYIAEEAENFIEAMELHDVADMQLMNLLPLERSRANVAAALIAAPPLIILDEYVACQKFSVRRGLYNILNHLRKRGHGILLSASNVECHIPISNRLMILVNGYLYDIDYVTNLLARYSEKGFTVVVHLKNEINVQETFSQYFDDFVINDTTDTLINIQVLDDGLRCVDIFNKMELMHQSNTNIYTYIVCGNSIDYVYNSICLDDDVVLERFLFIPIVCTWEQCETKLVYPTEEMVSSLKKFEKTYNITNLDGLPWSVVFQT